MMDLTATFVVLTADQFVGRDDGLLEQQKHISSDFKEKSESSLQPTIPRFAPTKG